MHKAILLACLVIFTPSVCAQPDMADSCIYLEAPEFYLGLHSSVMPVLIDTRSWKEFRRERIEGAVLAEDGDRLFEICDTLDHDHPLFVYCEDDYRSPVACRMLRERGFRNVYDLLGGLQAWKSYSYEVDRKKLKRKKN